MKKIFGLLVLLGILGAAVGGQSLEAPATPAPAVMAEAPKPAPRLLCDVSEAKQEERKGVVERLQRAGFIEKIITPGKTPRVYVMPAFQELTWDVKANFMGAIYAWAHECRAGERIRIFDAITNKALGGYDDVLGLRL